MMLYNILVRKTAHTPSTQTCLGGIYKWPGSNDNRFITARRDENQ